jgi:hypothetical protein
MMNDDAWQGKPKHSEKTYPSSALSTTNPTCPAPGRRGEKPATNRMSYGTAIDPKLTLLEWMYRSTFS